MIKKITLDSFKIVGISVRTTNQEGRSANDLMELWQRFYSENISSKISNKTDNNIYSVYTDYESDYTAGYTALIGHKVSSIDIIPEELASREFKGGNYFVFEAKGKIPAAVVNKWQEIWDNNEELNRSYTADFEVYGEKSNDPEDAEVEIYIATV
jgi:predicted transcriptional regulator YdeE